ncbi:MAG: hypothetical protein NVS3B7_12510 [Candidatus Elarobacter sp.]
MRRLCESGSPVRKNRKKLANKDDGATREHVPRWYHDRRTPVNRHGRIVCQAYGTAATDTCIVACPFPEGVSGLVHPDDEPYIAILEACAASRRSLGMPSYTRAELEQLFLVKDAPAPPPRVEPHPQNVIPMPARLGSRRRRESDRC